MVMKRNMMGRNLRRSIRKSFGRYIAIAVIIALGTAIFVGLRSTKSDMVATGQRYTDEQNMFDLRLLSSYGWDKEQLAEISALGSIEAAEGVFYTDLIADNGRGEESAVYRFYTIPHEINKLVLREGRMPEAENECLADGFRNKKNALGTTITISQDNDDASLDELNTREFTVVGLVSTPLYMDTNRGNTSVGSGSITNYYFVPEEAFDVSYYTEIHATIPGDYAIYSEEYNQALEAAAEELEPLLEPYAQARLISAKEQAEQAIADGQEEYDQGVIDYQREKEDALRQLEDARQELLDGEQELADGEAELEESRQKIADGWQELNANKEKLEQSEAALPSARSSGQSALAAASAQLTAKQSELNAKQAELEAGLVQINTGLAEIRSGITQIRTGIVQVEATIKPLEALIKIADINAETAQQTLERLEALGMPESHLEEARRLLELAQAEREKCQAQLDELYVTRDQLEEKLAEVTAQQSQLEEQRQQLLDGREQLRAGQQQIRNGFQEIANQRTSMENQLISAQNQILAGQRQIQAYERELTQGEKELAAGERTLEESREKLETGWADWETANQEAQDKFAEAEQELADAAAKLEDARQRLADITDTRVYVLDRNTNLGYIDLDSNSDIVAGVSRVFPVFFLLVAALVCITTMTRMVEEERTQIGTLKALGYSSGAIISKYLKYAGSSAILGSILGVTLGSVLFPMVLWQAYNIILYVTPNIELRFDWQMALSVTAMYTLAMLAVSWYCCHRALREVPAELIRPKAPAAGKALLMEKLPVWRHVSFLNKVAIRNIFRYRQRLLMMLLGIGGCTALLMTGFGIRDSISRIVDVQFRDVTKYDIEVYFQEGQSQEQRDSFTENMDSFAQNILFFYQVSGEIHTADQTRDIYLMAAGEKLTDFIDFHKGEEPVPMPGKDEVLLSSGMAEMLDVHLGDRVTLRNPDLEELDVTVSGIYENHVYNYAIVTPETVLGQWGREPELQMAYVSVKEGRNPSVAGAAANELEGVANVTVSQQMAKMVDEMMSALDLVVVVVVFCAGVLAVIVLYNLTNININERIREIATIKVLGFNAGETAMYVFKENLVLTLMGTIFGIPLGRLLLRFVMSQIKVDMIWIKPMLSNTSLLLSLGLTILSALMVDFLFYFRLDQINMAEALKSVE